MSHQGGWGCRRLNWLSPGVFLHFVFLFSRYDICIFFPDAERGGKCGVELPEEQRGAVPAANVRLLEHPQSIFRGKGGVIGGGGEGGRLAFNVMHSRSLKTIDPRIPTLLERRPSGFTDQADMRAHQARSALRSSGGVFSRRIRFDCISCFFSCRVSFVVSWLDWWSLGGHGGTMYFASLSACSLFCLCVFVCVFFYRFFVVVFCLFAVLFVLVSYRVPFY